MIEVIGEHSVDTSLLGDGWVFDVGCLGFDFSVGLKDLGCKVMAFDIQKLEPPKGIIYVNKAVSNYTGKAYVNLTNDKQATHLSKEGLEVDCISINGLYDQDVVDVLKLDCEGSEYLILSDESFNPTPRQITIEFHAHAFPELHAKYYDKCMENLLKYYVAVQHNWEDRHCAGFNYWDSLFIKKDLI